MIHSFELGQYLRHRYGIAEEPGQSASKLDFWTALQERGLNLESLYADLEGDPAVPRRLVDDFEAILRTAVVGPTGDRDDAKVCKYHSQLVEALEPGDYIVDFNWDTIAADALLLRSHFWFPATGFGLPDVGVLLARSQKAYPVQSLVTLLQIHGSVCLYEPVRDGDKGLSGVLYVGPRQWSAATGWLAIMGIDPTRSQTGQQPSATREPTQDEQDRIARGWIILKDRWFRPVFVPPSKRKNAYDEAYVTTIRRCIHTLLPKTEQLIVAGYSFPDADLPYLQGLFVGGILDSNMQLTIVNRSNNDVEFRSRVNEVFGALSRKDFHVSDFREFCEALDN
jgi:hypothetical protein